MKKNISINLFGTLYAIDEDAYNLLEQYLNSMKNYFSRQGESGLEIADDIEHRVAELLWEEKENGAEAVNIDMIKGIIGKIGDPAQIDGSKENGSSYENGNDDEGENGNGGMNESRTSNDNPNENGQGQDSYSSAFGENSSYNKDENAFDKFASKFKGRRFFRDATNKMIFGVCSGLSRFFGGDVTLWRIGVVVLTILLWSADYRWLPGFLSWIVPAGYLVLGLVAPLATTPEDRLRMRGADVNPKSINEEIINDSNSYSGVYTSQTPTQNNGGCLKLMFVTFLIILLFPVLATCLSLILAGPMVGGLVSSGFFSSISDIFGLEELDVRIMMDNMKLLMWIISFCALVVFIIPIFALINALRNDNKKTSGIVITILTLIWLIALGTGLFCIFRAVGEISKNTFNYAIENSDYPDFDDSSDSITKYVIINGDTIFRKVARHTPIIDEDTVEVDDFDEFDDIEEEMDEIEEGLKEFKEGMKEFQEGIKEFNKTVSKRRRIQ